MSSKIKVEPVENTDFHKLTLENYDHLPIKSKHSTAPSLKDLSKINVDLLEELLEFEVFEDDVWIITFPKCGTTWTQEMAWLLMNGFL